ncbi:LysM peptidoglycan-binding domain-containing protein [Flavobacterium sp. LMO8]|uniref:glucosaminidase domain-containing protein n=1 Tax=Flavobacterium sp. LMO8 TaxID=2654244 RepID=UPI0012925BF2|nr:glucosaminidase domain-containing protein [Flavobacterium sp. LMO8]MQP25543.1 LysM peptidoglycan-binding domain-containing protein [Flavobacterium sp. LMO8]
MKFKFALFILTLFVVSCTSTKPIVRTTTKPKVSTKSKSVTQKPAPKTTTKSTVVTSSTKPEIGGTKPKSDSEVSLVATSSVKTYTEEIQFYVDNFKEIAMNNMRNHGVPASITLAQGILESGAGKGKLAMSANNHFGIKCHTGWAGESVKHDDDAAQECFRKYEDPADSYRDHSLFLTSRSRYSNLFRLKKNDYESWAKGLKAAGYATDVKYPDKLIGLIERFELHKFDSLVLGNDFKSDTKEEIATQGGNYYTIQQGDTLYSLSKRFNVTINDLKKLNNMSDNSISIGQQLKIK